MAAIRLFLATLIWVSAFALPDEPDRTFDKLYQWGQIAYTQERWDECVSFMKRALADYKYYNERLVYCRKRCKIETPFSSPGDPFTKFNLPLPDRNGPTDDPVTDHLNDDYAERIVLSRISQMGLCFARCKESQFSYRPLDPVDSSIIRAFESLQPYSYMQLCYYKLNYLDRATSAAYTFMARNPDDVMMASNLKFYVSHAEYRAEWATDLEEYKHSKLYLEGADAYDAGDFMEAIQKFELALESYLIADEECRLLCFGPWANYISKLSESDDLWLRATGDYFATLRCRHQCNRRLSTLRGNYLSDYFGSHFDYLQFAYYKTKRVVKAAEAVATYLVFYPTHETMLYNKEFFLTQYKVPEAMFEPRQEIVAYDKRNLLEAKLLIYLERRFKPDSYKELPAKQGADYNWFNRDIVDPLERQWIIDNIDSAAKSGTAATLKPPPIDGDYGQEKHESTKQIPGPQPLRTKSLRESAYDGESEPNIKISPDKSSKEKSQSHDFFPSTETLSKLESNLRVRFLQKEKDLNGTFRFFLDNVLTPDECLTLRNLARLGELGDGYSGLTRPHREKELFRGISLKNAASLAERGSIPAETARLYLDKSSTAIDLVQNYFNLPRLYMDYTHLVCRDIDNEISNELDKDGEMLSHPIHGDNCILTRDNGICEKVSPAYTWRDFSALVYLNDDYDGGEFIFTDKELSIQYSVKPKCGEMVAFSASNLHGVRAVRRGQRCALAMWMTLDPDHQEFERIAVRNRLNDIEARANVTQKTKTKSSSITKEKTATDKIATDASTAKVKSDVGSKGNTKPDGSAYAAKPVEDKNESAGKDKPPTKPKKQQVDLMDGFED